MRAPSVLQTLLITISGAALAFFGCIGALSSGASETTVSRIGIVAFFAGGAVFLIGSLVLAVMIIKAIWHSLTQKQPPPPGAPSAPSAPGTESET